MKKLDYMIEIFQFFVSNEWIYDAYNLVKIYEQLPRNDQMAFPFDYRFMNK